MNIISFAYRETEFTVDWLAFLLSYSRDFTGSNPDPEAGCLDKVIVHYVSQWLKSYHNNFLPRPL
jgi:hypothetical protein